VNERCGVVKKSVQVRKKRIAVSVSALLIFIVAVATCGIMAFGYSINETYLLGPQIPPEASVTDDEVRFTYPLEKAEIAVGMDGYPGHTGVDFPCALGTDILASASGTVVSSDGALPGYKECLTIDHGNGYKTVYAHCSELLVNVGDKVETGQLIARSGTSGGKSAPMLHFEVIYNGVNVDPELYLSHD
jgi:murein DD-endopeptidase MepM/ murein hydrolase activator NlpD